MPAEVINATEKNKLAVHYYVRALALGIPAIFLGLQIAGWIGFVRIIADGHGECWCGRHLQRTDAFLLGITASGLVSYHLLIHDLTIMIVPLFLVLDHCLFSEGKGQNLFRTSALVLAAPILMAVSAAHFYLVAIPVSIFAVLMHSGKSAQIEQGSLLQPRSLPLSFGS